MENLYSWCGDDGTNLYLVRSNWHGIAVDISGSRYRFKRGLWKFPRLSYKGKLICAELIEVSRQHSRMNGSGGSCYTWLVWQGGVIKRIEINLEKRQVVIWKGEGCSV